MKKTVSGSDFPSDHRDVSGAAIRRGESMRPLPIQVKRTKRKVYCVFNKTRESFISLNVTVADTHLSRLRGLLGKLRLRADEGIWVVPSNGVHTIGVPFAVDLIYLDDKNRVIHLVESFGRFSIGPMRLDCLTVLELGTRAIYSSQTQVGDELLICSPEEMEKYLVHSEGDRSKIASD